MSHWQPLVCATLIAKYLIDRGVIRREMALSYEACSWLDNLHNSPPGSHFKTILLRDKDELRHKLIPKIVQNIYKDWSPIIQEYLASRGYKIGHAFPTRSRISRRSKKGSSTTTFMIIVKGMSTSKDSRPDQGIVHFSGGSLRRQTRGLVLTTRFRGRARTVKTTITKARITMARRMKVRMAAMKTRRRIMVKQWRMTGRRKNNSVKHDIFNEFGAKNLLCYGRCLVGSWCLLSHILLLYSEPFISWM
ncbi:hypothetical protein BD410DRAFT_787716 [Rickenella mellea]|uniref:Uncharacterized protein n=1 Tax=Rickenella mellea TaxID=50990 RepID=A0A4Y7Q6Q9_9AGAM|nr:hypothetical protein BD410DRAFT_787716 [Rickenella mellea]